MSYFLDSVVSKFSKQPLCCAWRYDMCTSSYWRLLTSPYGRLCKAWYWPSLIRWWRRPFRYHYLLKLCGAAARGVLGIHLLR